MYRFAQNYHFPALGYGALGFGFERYLGGELVDPYPQRRMVQASFKALEGPVAVAQQMALPVALTGNGANLTGQMALEALANLQNQTR